MHEYRALLISAKHYFLHTTAADNDDNDGDDSIRCKSTAFAIVFDTLVKYFQK